jgi:hypothetical protein
VDQIRTIALKTKEIHEKDTETDRHTDVQSSHNRNSLWDGPMKIIGRSGVNTRQIIRGREIIIIIIISKYLYFTFLNF